MGKERIAVLVDSGCDVPKESMKKYGMYVAPLKVLYERGEYRDGVDIQPDEVYQSLAMEIPKTSLPSGEEIEEILNQIEQDGYNKVIAVTISSGLSGTHNIISLIGKQHEKLEVFVLDTKNIGIGAGIQAIQAAKYIEEGLFFGEVIQKMTDGVSSTKVYFCISTLDYLQKGGRIGLVASLVGNALKLKPIISCNEEGIYHIVDKVRGRKHSVNRMMELAKESIPKDKKYNIGLAHGGAHEEFQQLREQFTAEHSGYGEIIETQVSPALGVHTGPGLLGICVQQVEG